MVFLVGDMNVLLVFLDFLGKCLLHSVRARGLHSVLPTAVAQDFLNQAWFSWLNDHSYSALFQDIDTWDMTLFSRSKILRQTMTMQLEVGFWVVMYAIRTYEWAWVCTVLRVQCAINKLVRTKCRRGKSVYICSECPWSKSGLKACRHKEG